MQFDIGSWAGLAGIPMIEQVVMYFRNQWRLPQAVMPLVALATGAALNVGLAYNMHTDPTAAFYVGLIAGFLSAPWHEIRKLAAK